MASQSPSEILVDISTMHMVARALHVVAEMGVADALGEEPMAIDTLARKVKAQPSALSRVLRLLANHGVFAFEGERVRHSEASRLMRSDDPNSMRPWIRMMGMPLNWQTYGDFEHAVRTGTSARNRIAGGEFFSDYLPKHPETAKLFDEAMTSAAHRRVRAVVEAYDFSRFGTIADIGGGRGHLIRGLLEANPGVHGILFDLPHAADPVRDLNVPRLTILSGDFFKSDLPRADLYMLMAVIHDWGDAESTKILTAVRKAAPDNAKLLLIEHIIQDGGEPNIDRRMDIHMLAVHSGRERTEPEFASLFKAAGFALERVIPTAGGSFLLEAKIAG